MTFHQRLLPAALLAALLIGCSDEASPACAGEACARPATTCTDNCAPPTSTGKPVGNTPPKEHETPAEPGEPVKVEPPKQEAPQLAELQSQLSAVATLTGEQLVAQSALPFANTLGYDPSQASNLDAILASSVKPSQAELSRLNAQGFSISNDRVFPTFTYGYASLYLEDLPVYISADSMLHAVHKSYDKGLMSLESSLLTGDVKAMLVAMRAQLGAGGAGWMPAESRGDLDLILALGLSLLDGKQVPLVAGGSSAQLDQLYGLAMAASGIGTVKLFGIERDLDFSQFAPRGHYKDNPLLEQYFRAMIWFGRTEFRLLETLSSGEQVFRRRQLETAIGLIELLDGEAQQRFERVDQIIGLFVGEHDSMTPGDAKKYLADLGIAGGSGLAAFDDATLAQKLIDGGHGAQRIASQLMLSDRTKTLPLHRSFQLFGQRYTVDSHVFSNVVFDRAGGGSIMRMMPDPLDAAYAALGNDQAAVLLAPELQKYPYAPDLVSMRILIDAHGSNYWDGSLYTLWLSSLRALSPSTDALTSGQLPGLPAVARTEAWGRRILNTQLASWAELRHDTLLYAKQSYTGGAECAFPDAYVDPYPEFYANLARYAERGDQLLQSIPPSPGAAALDALRQHFSLLLSVSQHLQGMAERQRTGQAFTAEQMAFVNDAVVVKTENQGCTSIQTAKGWYPSLFLSDPLEYDPTIADVHTQPYDEGGSPVGRILHVATGAPRRMIVTVDTCSGPRAYVGLVSSYGEKITENFERYTDQQWAAELQGKAPAAVPWMNDLVGP